MGSALLVELLNLRFRKKRNKHHLDDGGPRGTGHTPEKPKIDVDPQVAAPGATV
jgi:hypothetical protein